MENKLELGMFLHSGGTASQYIKSILGEQSLAVITWNEPKPIDEGKELANNIIHRYNNYDSLLSILKYLLSSYKADFENITGSPLNDTEAVKKAKEAIAAAEQL